MIHKSRQIYHCLLNFRRAGDVATSYAEASLAEKALGWKAKRGLKEMCEDTWRWQKNNPNGFKKVAKD